VARYIIETPVTVGGGVRYEKGMTARGAPTYLVAAAEPTESSMRVQG